MTKETSKPMTYGAKIVDSLGESSTRYTRRYPTWEAAHHAAESLLERSTQATDTGL